MRLLFALLLIAVFVAPARAGSDEEERARAHYEIGLGLYRLADYRGAVREFSAGYQLAHKPGFLLNLGQSYRKLGELRAARDEYRQFLIDAPGDDPARPEARKVLAELEKAVAASATAPAWRRRHRLRRRRHRHQRRWPRLPRRRRSRLCPRRRRCA